MPTITATDGSGNPPPFTPPCKVVVCLSEPGTIEFRCDPPVPEVPDEFKATKGDLCTEFEIPASVQGLLAVSSGAPDLAIV